MNKMKILVLLDGSMWSHKGALYALRIAKKKKADVVLFSVLDKRDSKSMAFNFCNQSNMCSKIENYESQIWRDLRKNINDEMAQLLLFFNREGIQTEVKVVEGTAAKAIITEVQDNEYGLVVMGGYGRNPRSGGSSLLPKLLGDLQVPVFMAR